MTDWQRNGKFLTEKGYVTTLFGELRGGKGSLHEGGVRVPTIDSS